MYKTQKGLIGMKNKINIKSLIICMLIPLAVGGLSALLTMGSMQDFEALNQPPLSPRGWLFPIVWTALYLLMGLASYLVLLAPADSRIKRDALKSYFLQLGFNFFWSIIFFSLGAYEIAFAWLCILLALIVITAARFYRINKAAGLIMLPYILWVAFAGYLNFAIASLN